jgi:hypothetical protein
MEKNLPKEMLREKFMSQIIFSQHAKAFVQG